MNVTHYVTARQTGKTTKAISIFNQNGSPDTYLIVANAHIKLRIARVYGIPPKQIATATNYRTFFNSKHIRTLIIDEYLIGLDNKILFWRMLTPNMTNDSNVFLLSTPKIKYTHEDLVANTYLYLINSEEVNVINVHENPYHHGFRRITLSSQQHLRNYFFDNESFDCEMLGLYLVGQEFSNYIIPPPKKFILKDVV